MDVTDQWMLVTGAGGGIGSAIATRLARHGARLIVTGRNENALLELRRYLDVPPQRCIVSSGDLRNGVYRNRLTALCAGLDGGLRVLINNAGINHFALLDQLDDERIEDIITTNLTMPILLTRTLLPQLQQQSRAQIINIGSTFGSIGFAGFTAYSASKFGLRGFSEALRRELADTDIAVSYLAPRATHTAFNSHRVNDMNQTLGNRSDTPDRVATAVMRCLLGAQRTDAYLGWPEKLFVRLNGLVPRLVDNTLKKQLATVKNFSLQPLDKP